MKLTYFQLEPHLSKQFSSIYLVSGEDVWLKQDAMRMIQKSAKKAGFSEKIRFRVNDLDEKQLYNTLYSQPLFGEKQLIEIYSTTLTTNKAIATILQEYAKNPMPHILLVIDTGKLESQHIKSACYQQIEKHGVIINIWPIPREQMPQWIQQQARRYKMQFSNAAINLLTDYSEGNLIAAAEAIEKCYLLHPQKPIDETLIETVLIDETQFTIFDFVDSIISSNLSRSLHILSTLKTNNIEPTLIIWSIARELRLLAAMAQQIKQGMLVDNLLQKNKIFFRRQPLIKKFLNKFQPQDCWIFLQQIAEIDRSIKGANSEDIWSQLQFLCLRMA